MGDRTTARTAGVSVAAAIAGFIAVEAAETPKPQKKPNILVIFGDDIGMWNVGAYTHGMMGNTPSIDRIASEGMLFTDHYGQPSCTAGRAAFIMGQLPVRTGMTTVGIPGSTRGIQKSDPTRAEVLKSVGYATAQFGGRPTRTTRPPTRSSAASAGRGSRTPVR
jgi:arylsulfatase